MKKTNFTNIQSSGCLGTNWLREVIPLLVLFVFALPMQVQAQGTQAPNCSNFSPSIDGSGNAIVSARDFLTNAENAQYPVKVSVKNQWGTVIFSPEFTDPDITYAWYVCPYLG